MKLLEIGKFFPPALGGIETHFSSLVRHLQGKVDLDVMVFNHRLSLLSRREQWSGQPILRLGCQARLFSAPLSAQLPVHLSLQTWDVIHLHLPNPQVEALCLLPWIRSKIVLSWHSDVVRQRKAGMAMRPLTRKLLVRASRIIVASKNLARNSPFLSGFQGKCRVIPYGVEPQAFERTEPVARAGESLRTRLKNPVVLFVGRLVYYKGVDLLIRVAARTRAMLVVIGTGPHEQRLKRIAKQTAPAGNVLFLGEVDPPMLAAAYHACDIFCLPSVERSEAFGIVQLEAMICGKPVISTNLPTGVPEVNLDQRTGLVVRPGDEQELEQAVCRLLDNPELREEMGQRARQRAIRCFGAQQMAKSTLAVLREATRP